MTKLGSHIESQHCDDSEGARWPLQRRAQSLPPGDVVSLVAFETSAGARGSIQLRKTYIETSKTYFCSSSASTRSR